MPESEQARDRLAQLMNERRVELGLRWTSVAKSGDISPETLRAIRRTSAPLRDLTKAGIEKGLRWEHGSVDRILAGDDPVPDDGEDAFPDLSALSPERRRDLIDALDYLKARIEQVEREERRRGA
jgi:hypothetical protein